MMPLKKTPIAGYIFLILLFLCMLPMDMVAARGEHLDTQLLKAKNEYMKQDYNTAVIRLERLVALYGNINNSNEYLKIKQGQSLLLSGACYERLNKNRKAEENYLRAKQILGKNFVVPGVKLKKMPIYQRVRKLKL